ncbi:MAG TPA: isoprenylcysteine carboxylmethyltransferase family protein [Pyrinomonadaceae bacterium]
MGLSLPLLVFAVVMLSWLAFVIVFLIHKKPASGPERKRESSSMKGLGLQGAGYAIIWIVHRRYFSSIAEMNRSLEIVLAVFTCMLAIFSVWLAAAAIKTLGKQWSIAARVVEGHQLITAGPYSFVRNPIYTGMLGMLLATGLAVSHWIGLLAGLILFAIGTIIRVRSEEKLLRETFGGEWEEYARRVPALVPLVY